MPGKSPGFWFFTGDWMKDPELRFCSIFARGLLVDLLCLMFEGKRCGYLSKPDGTPRSDADVVSAISGGTTEEKLAALYELESSGVLSRDENGVLYSRRLARLAELSEKRKQSGSKGGSKTQAKAKASVKQTDKQNTGVSDSVSDSVSVSTEAKKKTIQKKTYGEEFSAWYDEFPRKTHKAEAAVKYPLAVAIVKKQHPDQDPHEILISAARSYARSRSGEEPKFTKNPSAWLHSERWNDEALEDTRTPEQRLADYRRATQ